MANSILDSILGMLTPEMTQKFAARLRQPPQSVQNGLAIATAATLTGVANRADEPGFLGKVEQTLSGASGQSLLSSLPSIATGGPTGAAGDLVSRFLPSLFGARQEQVVKLISQRCGFGAESSSEILKAAAALVLGYFAKLFGAGTLSATTLGNALKTQAAGLGAYVPPDLLRGSSAAGTSTIGTSAVAAGATRAVDGPERVEEVAARPSNVIRAGTPASGSWRWPLLAAIAGILLLGWLYFRSVPVGRYAGTAITSTTGTPAEWASLGAPTAVTLPDGMQLNIPANGVESRLLAYLQSGTAATDQVISFDFDRLRFDTGKATLQPASGEQLNNVAAILKAYPAVKIRLGGYTDNTGDAGANQQLSEARAQNVMAQLTERGIDPTRLSATGYGEENPVADNSTEEGRQKNRRVSIRVAEK